ncbi:MAG: hypothetical protein H5U10_03715 [Desulfacinum sp.]|jgi:hypothetical protein|nr:hypothetical protein [Desulfacinum sp.]
MEGVYLAVGMVAIYVLFGPLVLLGLYIFFDRLAESGPEGPAPATGGNGQERRKDASLWTQGDAERYVRDRASGASA